jgi:hypothetical protein
VGYQPQTWIDGPGGNTPINAARLTYMENGIAAAAAAAASVVGPSGTILGTQPLLTTTSLQTGAYAASSNQFVPCSAVGGSFTVTLPTGAVMGTIIAVKLLATSGTNAVTVSSSGGDSINSSGTTTAQLVLTGESFEFVASGGGIWYLYSGQKSLGTLDARYLAASGTPSLEVTGLNGASPLIFAGRLTTVGAPSTGTWALGDTVQDSTGAWFTCTVAGTPGTWVSSGGNYITEVTKTVNYTLTNADNFVIANGTALTMTLPSAATAGAGRSYLIKNASTSGLLTVASTSGNIDNSVSVVLAPLNAARYISDGSQWWSIGKANLGPVTIAYASTLNTDCSQGELFEVALTGNATLANPTNMADGQKVTWRFTQDATGSRVLTLGAAFNGVFALSVTANAVDYLQATYNGATSKWDILNERKSLLNFGTGAPGAITGAQPGDIYLDFNTLNIYQET